MEVENDENNNRLSDESIQFLVRQLMVFIDSKYSKYKWEDIENVCRAATSLFPCIELVSKFTMYICIRI